MGATDRFTLTGSFEPVSDWFAETGFFNDTYNVLYLSLRDIEWAIVLKNYAPPLNCFCHGIRVAVIVSSRQS